MPGEKQKYAYIRIHIAVFLFGFTAILGHLIQLSSVSLVWWRVLITCASLLFFIRWGKTLSTIPEYFLKRYAFIGVLVGLHWICFYGAIKLSNASIALVCMATTSFFTSFIEPLVLKQRYSGLEIFLGLFIIPGMLLIVNSTELAYMNGIWVGLAAAFLAACFAVLNKKYISNADPYSITFIELGSAWLFLTVILAVMLANDFEAVRIMPPSIADWLYLIVLALLCTTLAYVLSLQALKYISAFNSNLIINLEPLYGILLAVVILNEHKELTTSFYAGCGVILAAVLAYPFLRKMKSSKNINR